MSAGMAALALRFIVMAVATFLSIVVWSRFRDASWMLIVIGIIAGYGDILYSLLVEFGFLPEIGQGARGAEILAFVFPNLPWLFFSAAFIAMLAKNRNRG
ncbi:MAG: hypothetical protein KKA67_00785 [Spirochaetes bacterium]|nr:hypothetical protein [Spirochaetota bacterium]MBU1079730.1 hypothetical protein [Spirochaetota bacterium]